MAKRFSDSDKWKKTFFSDLSTEAKLVWIYLLDNCDNTGVWSANFKLLSFQVGFDVAEKDVKSWFSSKIVFIENDKILIKPFIEFQYGALNHNNNAHKPVLKMLEKLAPFIYLDDFKDLNRASLGAQDKDKDKDKDKDQDKDRKIHKKPIESFLGILDSVQVLDISLKNGAALEKFKEPLCASVVFGDRLPIPIKRNPTKFLATMFFVYESSLEDFKHQVNSVINEVNTKDLVGPTRSDYILTRLQNKALEVYNAVV